MSISEEHLSQDSLSSQQTIIHVKFLLREPTELINRLHCNSQREF